MVLLLSVKCSPCSFRYVFGQFGEHGVKFILNNLPFTFRASNPSHKFQSDHLVACKFQLFYISFYNQDERLTTKFTCQELIPIFRLVPLQVQVQ